MEILEQSWGLEIEFTGITREHAANLMAEYLKENGLSDGYIHRFSSYDERSCNDNQGRVWRIISDSSIVASRNTDDDSLYHSMSLNNYKCEFVTPICNYSDFETVRGIIGKFANAKAKTNDSCGIHVHVDGSKHNGTTLKNLSNIVYSKEDLLVKALQVRESGLDMYSQKTEPRFIDELNQKKNKNPSIKGIAKIWYNTDSDDTLSYYENSHYHHSRYRILNLHSYFMGKGVEFRCFNSTLHRGKIKAYLQLSLAINAQAINQRSASAKPTKTTNEAYTFRTWLLRMGLIGDEFKTCRQHLMCNLEGTKDYNDKKKHIAKKQAEQREQSINEQVIAQIDVLNTNLPSVLDDQAREQISQILRQQIINAEQPINREQCNVSNQEQREENISHQQSEEQLSQRRNRTRRY